jgi:hypothetical protein
MLFPGLTHERRKDMNTDLGQVGDMKQLSEYLGKTPTRMGLPTREPVC